MKRILPLLLAITLCLCLVSCGKKETNKSETGTSAIADTNVSTATAEATTATTDATTSTTDTTTVTTDTTTQATTPATDAATTPTVKPATTPTIKPTAPTEAPHTHSWKNATCTAPKTCTVCSTKEGNPSGHNYVYGKCSVCSVTNANYITPDSGTWCTGVVSEDGKYADIYSVNLSEPHEQGGSFPPVYRLSTKYRWHRRDLSASDEPIASYEIVKVNGVEYVGNPSYTLSLDLLCPFTEEDNTLTLRLWGSDTPTENLPGLLLTRTAGNQFTVTEHLLFNLALDRIPIGTVFTFCEE